MKEYTIEQIKSFVKENKCPECNGHMIDSGYDNTMYVHYYMCFDCRNRFEYMRGHIGNPFPSLEMIEK